MEPLKVLEKFGKIPWTHKLGGTVVLIAAIVGITYVFVIQSKMDEIEANNEQIAKQEAELAKLSTQAQFRPQYMREVERLKQRLREAEEQLPKKAEIPKLLRDISYEASQSGLNVSRFELKAEQTQGDFAAVPVAMTVKGSYHEIAVFLDRLSKMSRIVNANDLTMTSPGVKNKKIVLSSTFNATTYRFIDR